MIKNKERGQPGLNRWPLDLQSNALPLSYAPLDDIQQRKIMQMNKTQLVGGVLLCFIVTKNPFSYSMSYSMGYCIFIVY